MQEAAGADAGETGPRLALSVNLRRRSGLSVENRPDKVHNGKLVPLLERLLGARDLDVETALDYALSRMLPPDDLAGLSAAAGIISDALQSGKRILIVGDFDADGATSTALALRALRSFGAENADFVVPNRFLDGYGLSPSIVDAIAAAPDKPALIITVDNGISSIEGVERASHHAIDVIVTDHHLAGSQLPAALAIVNPNQPGCSFKSKNLAGVGVIFYVMAAVRRELDSRGHFADRRPPKLAQLLDLVALGTVADVVALDHNNRTLVAQGLERIRAGRCCQGIAAVLRIAGRDLAAVSAGDLGFLVGPRLNAAGRMDDMSIGIRCLLSDDPLEASELAAELDRFNVQRKRVESRMRQEAENILAGMAEIADKAVAAKTVCLYDDGWHQGVIGIVAGRLKERLHRPAIVFAPAESLESAEPAGNGRSGLPLDTIIKGSARSIPGLHIRDALEAVSREAPDLILAFGGHAMAAGLTLRLGGLDRFKDLFDSAVAEAADEAIFTRTVMSDGGLEADEFCLGSAEIIAAAGPWGQAFPEPIFDGYFTVDDIRTMKDRHLKLMVRPASDGGRGGEVTEALMFNAPTEWLDWAAARNFDRSRLHLVYRLDINDFRGRRSLQLMIDHCGLA